MPVSAPKSEPLDVRNRSAELPSRDEYVQIVLDLYLAAPGMPARARPFDRRQAFAFFRHGIPLPDIAHALRLVVVRRHCRPSRSQPLEPIRSLAYFCPLLSQFRRDPPPVAQVDWIEWRYWELMAERAQKRG